MQELANIENALEASTAKDQLHDLLATSADYTIEKLLDLGESIPVVSYLTKGMKATFAIREWIFMEKVIKFLQTLGEVPTEQHLAMINKIQDDASFSEKFGKVSLAAIERFDSLQKVKLLGQIAKYLAREEITYSVYKRCAYIIDNMYIDDIFAFANTDSFKNYNIVNLEPLGLIWNEYEVSPNLYSGSLESYAYKSLPPDKVKLKNKDTMLGQVFRLMILEKEINQIPGYINIGIKEIRDFLKERYG